MYYNTTGLNSQNLKDAFQKAKTQDQKILEIFKDRKGTLLNPFHVHMVYCNVINSDTPLTSIRRSMSTLTKQGLLIKSESATSRGKYGKANHVWVYNGD